jgi:hypothetical protein
MPPKAAKKKNKAATADPTSASSATPSEASVQETTPAADSQTPDETATSDPTTPAPAQATSAEAPTENQKDAALRAECRYKNPNGVRLIARDPQNNATVVAGYLQFDTCSDMRDFLAAYSESPSVLLDHSLLHPPLYKS